MDKQPPTGELQPLYQSFPRQKCFIAHSYNTSWRKDIIETCQHLLPKFGLEPWYADEHFDATTPLRDKVVEMIANARYGIYDLSYWRANDHAQWQVPRNVFIELGMAIALNRPTLLLRNKENHQCGIKLPSCLQGVHTICEFTGQYSLSKVLSTVLPQWVQRPPEQDWRNRYCIFGALDCSHRERHPQAQRRWEQEHIQCHISDGNDIDQEDFRNLVETILQRFSNLACEYLDVHTAPRGYNFLLCSHCQKVRSASFAIYRITPNTSPKTFIAIGMSIALERQFDYHIPKILLVKDEADMPSLLNGYEFVRGRTESETKRRLQQVLQQVIQQVRQTSWKPKPLPFEVSISPPINISDRRDEDASDVQEQVDTGSDTQDITTDDESISPFSRTLRDIFQNNPEELERVARELKVREVTLHRWMTGQSSPNTRSLRMLLEALPEHRAALADAINQTFPGALDTLPPKVPANQPVKIFISYSRKDQSYLDELIRHMVLLTRSGEIDIWHDGLIQPGMDIVSEIHRNLNAAQIVLLLVSADFMVSNSTYAEMKRALERYERGEIIVIPILLRSVHWQSSPLGMIQPLPADGRPIKDWPDQDEAFLNVALGIRRVVKEIRTKNREQDE